MASQFSQRGHPSIHEEFGAYWTLRMAALNTKLPAGKDVKSAGSLVPSLSTGYPHYPQRANRLVTQAATVEFADLREPRYSPNHRALKSAIACSSAGSAPATALSPVNSAKLLASN